MPLLLLAAVFGLITSLYLVSCNKNNEINDPQDRTASAVLDRNGDTPFSALTVSAINHKGTEDYEFAGQTLYEHRMFFSHRDPLTYFNFSPEEKAAIDVATAEFNLKFKDLETPEAVIAKMQSEGLISTTSQD